MPDPQLDADELSWKRFYESCIGRPREPPTLTGLMYLFVRHLDNPGMFYVEIELTHEGNTIWDNLNAYWSGLDAEQRNVLLADVNAVAKREYTITPFMRIGFLSQDELARDVCYTIAYHFLVIFVNSYDTDAHEFVRIDTAALLNDLKMRVTPALRALFKFGQRGDSVKRLREPTVEAVAPAAAQPVRRVKTERVT